MQQGELFPMDAGATADVKKIIHTIDLAKREVNRQNPDLALVHLQSLKYDIDDYSGTLPWAEFSLVRGEALLAKLDAKAGEALKESLDRISSLPGDYPDLMIRANRAYATYLDRSSEPKSNARKYYEAAKQLAVKQRYREDSAEITLRIIRIDLELKGSPELPNLRLLKRTADSFFTCQEQLAAWHQHLGNIEIAAQGRVFARNERVANAAYFRYLLELAREGSVEEDVKE